MELKKIKKTKKELEIEIKYENAILLNPITEVLLLDDDVDYASYISDHPEAKKRTLYIRVKKGDPLDILKKSVKKLEKEIKNFSKDFETKAKSKK